MLGKRQKETLAKYAKSMTDGDESKTLIIRIHPWRQFTREQGGGSGHPVTLQLDYGDDYPESKEWMGCCSSEETSKAKGQEIARHLCDLGVPKDKVKLRWAKKG